MSYVTCILYIISDINNNFVGDEGAISLSAVVACNTGLQELSIWNNGLSDAAAQCFISSLKGSYASWSLRRVWKFSNV